MVSADQKTIRIPQSSWILNTFKVVAAFKSTWLASKARNMARSSQHFKNTFSFFFSSWKYSHQKGCNSLLKRILSRKHSWLIHWSHLQQRNKKERGNPGKEWPERGWKSKSCRPKIWLLYNSCFFIEAHAQVRMCRLVLALRAFISVQFSSSVTQSCPTLWDTMDCSTPGLPAHHQLPEFTQTHVHWVDDAIQPSYPLSSHSPPALNLSQYQGLFKWVSSLHQVAKVFEFQLQHQSFLWTLRTDLL